jgi:hypothetical protein
VAASPPSAGPPPIPPPGDGEPAEVGPSADGGDSARRKPFLLRLPPDLMAELRAWSAQELRSLNGHLEFLLREAVRQRRRARKKDESP